MHRPENYPRRRAGFSLVELAVVIVTIAVLTAFGVPRFIKSVERSRAAEAFEYLASVGVAQERHQAQHGTYAASLADLVIKAPAPEHFAAPAGFSPAEGSTLQHSWSLTLTRTGPSAGYGPYTVTFTQAGFDAANSTINRGEAAADINPMGR